MARDSQEQSLEQVSPALKTAGITIDFSDLSVFAEGRPTLGNILAHRRRALWSFSYELKLDIPSLSIGRFLGPPIGRLLKD